MARDCDSDTFFILSFGMKGICVGIFKKDSGMSFYIHATSWNDNVESGQVVFNCGISDTIL